MSKKNRMVAEVLGIASALVCFGCATIVSYLYLGPLATTGAGEPIMFFAGLAFSIAAAMVGGFGSYGLACYVGDDLRRIRADEDRAS